MNYLVTVEAGYAYGYFIITFFIRLYLISKYNLYVSLNSNN